MFDYMKKIKQCDAFYTIPEMCKFLEMTKEELRSKCEQYGVDLYNWDGQWGLPSAHFRAFNNLLYYEQCRDGYDDSHIFADTSTSPAKMTQQQTPVLSYIKHIKGLESTYSVDKACALLGVTPDLFERICDENNLLRIQDLDGTMYITCYEYLTLNNILYRKQCVISGEKDACV